MSDRPFDQWMSLYDNDVESAWYSQKTELRNAAMVLKALDNVLKGIYKKAENKFKLFERTVQTAEETVAWSPSDIEKENINIEQSPISQTFLPSSTPKSPELNERTSGDDRIVDNFCTSPKINKPSKFTKLKRLKQHGALNYSALTTKTPPNKTSYATDIIDSTVIDKTPNDSHTLKKERSKFKNISKNKFRSRLIDGTLTQMFSNNNSTKDLNNDSQATICTAIIEPSSPEKCLVQSNNHTIQKNQNARLFKEPIVRGKARQNLEGWNCADCEMFYKELSLNTQETKKLLNKCSKHRSKFKPIDYTPKGFWDLKFSPTQNEENGSSDSTYFQY